MPNTSDKIFAIVRDLARSTNAVRINEVMDRCTSKGFKPDQVDNCLRIYEDLNIWQVNATRTTITFI